MNEFYHCIVDGVDAEDNPTCVRCADGYYFGQSDFRLQCFKCKDNCSLCRSLRYCDMCDVGYYRRQYLTHVACERCGVNCAHCDDAVTCVECVPPFVLDSAECRKPKCQEAMANCRFCKGEFPEYECIATSLIVTSYVWAILHLFFVFSFFFWGKCRCLRRKAVISADTAIFNYFENGDGPPRNFGGYYAWADDAQQFGYINNYSYQKIKAALYHFMGDDFDPPPLYQESADE